MNTTINVKQLKQALVTVSPAVGGKTTTPILKSVMLREWCGALQIEATDMELAMQVTLDDVAASGEAVTVPHKELANVLKSIKSGEVTIESFETKAEPAEDGKEPPQNLNRWITVTTPGCGKIKMNGLSGFSWPEVPTADSMANILNINIPQLTAAMKRIAIAVSHDMSRFTLNGCLFKHTRNKLTLASTDGHRMVLDEITTRARKEFTAMLTWRAISALSKLKDKGELQMAVDERYFHVAIGGTRMIARCLTGSFPDYERAIPRHNDKNYVVGREPLVKAMEQMLPLTDEKNPVAIFEFRPDGLRISSRQDNVGAAEFSVPATEAAHHLVRIGFNVNYALSYIKLLDSGLVTFSLANDHSATLITASSLPDSKYVLMPFRGVGVTLDEEDTASAMQAEADGHPEIRDIIIGDAAKDAERADNDRVNGREPAPKPRIRFPNPPPAEMAWKCSICDTVNASGIEVCGCGDTRKYGAAAEKTEEPSAERFDELHQVHEPAEIDAEKEPELEPAGEPCQDHVAYEDQEVSEEEVAAFLANMQNWMAKIIAATFPHETTNGAYYA